MQVQGIIDSIYTKSVPTKRGEGTVYHAMIGGQDINLGFKNSFAEGEYVVLEVEKKYGGLQMLSGAPATKGATTTTGITPKAAYAALTGGTKAFPVDLNSKDHSIIRQNSLTNAVATIKTLFDMKAINSMSPEDLVETTLGIAYKFCDFSTGQREVRMSREAETNVGKA